MSIELDDSSSLPMPELLPMPDSLPMPIPMSVPMDGMVSLSAGRATGRPPPSEVDGRAAALVRDAGFEAALRLVPLALVRLAVVRLAVLFFLPPDRDAVERFAVVRLAVDFLPPDRLAVDRLAVDFFVDFFFAAICPPFGARFMTARSNPRRMIPLPAFYSIGIQQTQACGERYSLRLLPASGR
jgi:hypothetical protein